MNSIESWKIPKRTKRYYINVSGTFLRPFREDPLGPLGGPWEFLRGRSRNPPILIKKRQCRARFLTISTFRAPSAFCSRRRKFAPDHSGFIGISGNRTKRYYINVSGAGFRARRREARVEFFLEEPLGPHGNSHAAGPGNPLQKGFV